MELLAESFSPHPPTQALLDALRESGWLLASILPGRAVLRHPERMEVVTVGMDADRTDRFAWCELDFKPFDLLGLTEFVRGS